MVFGFYFLIVWVLEIMMNFYKYSNDATRQSAILEQVDEDLESEDTSFIEDYLESSYDFL
jgi:hypothetical protein